MAGKWRSLSKALKRKKVFEPEQLEASNLRRCLTLWDLTALGLGSTLGVGVYVLVGSVALHIAGPSIVLSFFIAAVASLFAGLCYAEFGARVPRAGSAYIYSYVAVGEFVAFVIGWNMILESVFGTASVARGLSMYVDSMLNKTMSGWFQEVFPINSVHLSLYFDLFSFLAVIVLGALLSLGVRESSSVNNVLAALNMIVILFIVVAGAFKADASNWSIPSESVPDGSGVGGFFPFGVWGTLRGAAICFYGFVGFDAINATGEEVREPRRTIPQAILFVLSLVLVAYVCVATVVTMMVPYYLQDSVASVATAFAMVGWPWARWVVSIGAVFGISASLFGAMFPLPRLLYAMAADGLLPRPLGALSSSRRSPVVATLLPTAVIATLSSILELEQLVMMMCVGTLLSYTIVAACVILLSFYSFFYFYFAVRLIRRYRSDKESPDGRLVTQLLGCGTRSPSKLSARIVDTLLLLFICVSVSTALVGTHLDFPVVPLAVLHGVAVLMMIIMMIQPQAEETIGFKTPLVPIIPCLSIYVNIHLMILINVQTWIRVVIWIAIGIIFYTIGLCCCRRNNSNLDDNISSHANKNGKPQVQIIVESPTPPDTIKTSSNNGGEESVESGSDKYGTIMVPLEENVVRNNIPFITEEIIMQQAIVEDNEEKEAKIIDLLDQVLQAEEDSYEEIISLKEQREDKDVTITTPNSLHRKSLSELSDAGSDASIGNQALSKYDVIAQVHREDLPKVTEEEERIEKDDDVSEIKQMENYEEVTAFNDSDTNSRTDESGYSDTIDRTILNETVEDSKEPSSTIPTPPPLDENFFASPAFKKSYTISSRPSKATDKLDEENKPRESIKSNGSFDDGPMIFGSDKQINFMSKLNNIFQTKMSSDEDGDEHRKRSHSAGNLTENTDFALKRERPQMFADLKKELLSKEAAQNLRHVNTDESKSTGESDIGEDEDYEEKDTSLSREDLKSKLENIFAAGGPKFLNTRLMKSNPPTPEESYHTDTSSTESISKLPKVEKNDTLKRQKAKFGEVLNSFKMSLNKSDDV